MPASPLATICPALLLATGSSLGKDQVASSTESQEPFANMSILGLVAGGGQGQPLTAATYNRPQALRTRWPWGLKA